MLTPLPIIDLVYYIYDTRYATLDECGTLINVYLPQTWYGNRIVRTVQDGDASIAPVEARAEQQSNGATAAVVHGGGDDDPSRTIYYGSWYMYVPVMAAKYCMYSCNNM
ncbi:hypothetical protein RRF57_002966 [Xylaria bambusicola]|uniref:Uncharacterized protein n=1 Tax=Xylaria bambusicola TaxID=326684 RepID=A0AAN7UL14_9PEZI